MEIMGNSLNRKLRRKNYYEDYFLSQQKSEKNIAGAYGDYGNIKPIKLFRKKPRNNQFESLPLLHAISRQNSIRKLIIQNHNIKSKVIFDKLESFKRTTRNCGNQIVLSIKSQKMQLFERMNISTQKGNVPRQTTIKQKKLVSIK